MNILVLGSAGMIGGGLSKYFGELEYRVFAVDKSRFNIDLDDTLESINNKLNSFSEYRNSDIIINCIGIVKQKIDNYEQGLVAFVNSDFPMLLSKIVQADKKILVQISTDCVFSGERGFYDETDDADAQDLYGKTKAISETVHKTAFVIRTSTIGIERGDAHGLLGWYLSQKSSVNGFMNAIYSGISLRELCVSIDALLKLDIRDGLYNVSSDPISKHDLLWLLHMVGVGPKILPDYSVVINRSLDDKKFRETTHLRKPNWIEMVLEIKKEIEETHNYG